MDLLLDLRAYDSAGNFSPYSLSVQATTPSAPDTTPPTVSLTAPANGAVVAGVVIVRGTAADNVGVVGVQFKLDDANLGPEDTVPPYETPWDTTQSAAGGHNLSARVRDAAGNTTSASPVAVTVSNNLPPPSVGILSPANGANIHAHFKMQTHGSDSVGIKQVQYLFDGAVFYTKDFNPPVPAFLINPNVVAPDTGPHSLQAKVVNTSNNIGLSGAINVNVTNGGNNLLSVITSDASGAVLSQSAGASKGVMVSLQRGAGQTLAFAPEVQEVRVVNSRGAEVFFATSTGEAISIPASQLTQTGIYVVRMTLPDEQIVYKAVVAGK